MDFDSELLNAIFENSIIKIRKIIENANKNNIILILIKKMKMVIIH